MKSILTYTLVLTALVIAALTLGCTDRGDNYNLSGPTWEDNLVEGGQSPMEHSFFQELLMQTRNKFQMMRMVAYLPDIPQANEPGGGDIEPLPLLILLAPQDGTKYYYFNHGLEEVADELITKGIIDPMMIVSVENDPVFGGYFYAGGGSAEYYWEGTDEDGQFRSGTVNGSPGSGNYDDILGRNIVNLISTKQQGRVVNDSTQWGIGGFGMGAYGAFRAAMMHPNTFHSVSGVDGPMDFDGPDGNSGMINLVDQVFMEQNIPYGVDSAYKRFDTAGAWHASRLFVGGSIAFSPLDTLVYTTVLVAGPQGGGTGPNRQIVRVDSTFGVDLASAPTAITDLVKLSQEGNKDFDFLLPFDANGTMVNDVWNDKWLPNNLESLFSDEPGAQSALTNADIWIGSSTQARFGYHDQTQSWYNTIAAVHPNNSADTLVWYDYDGYAGYGASHDQYVYDLLREMLIFHDRSFKKAQGR